jgi:hypothetical protein
VGARQRFFDGENRGEGIDVEANQLPGPLQQIFVWVRQQNDRLFRVIDLAGSQARLILGEQQHAVFSGNIRGGNHGDFFPGHAGIEMNFAKDAAGNGAAHGDPKQHAGSAEIIDVSGAAGHLLASLFAGNGPADLAMIHGWSQ